MAALAAAFAVLLAARGCDDDGAEERHASPHVGAEVVAPPGAVASKPARARAGRDTPSPLQPPTTADEPLFVDGWPAAQIVVRRADGHVASGAAVYIHPAGADTPQALQDVPRTNADAEGRATFVAPAPGRYDIGAFSASGFATLVTDVELPARAPVEITLPDCARLEIRSDGELPRTGRVTVCAAAAARVRAFPGRRESKYAAFGTEGPLPPYVEIPRGTPFRVDATGGVVAEPREVSAPATITVRADGKRAMRFEFAFSGATAPPDAGLDYELFVAVAQGGGDSERTLRGRAEAGSRVAPVSTGLWCVPSTTEVRWEIRGVATGSSVVDTSRPPDDGMFRVEIPVADWRLCADALRLHLSGPNAATAIVVSDMSGWHVSAGRDVRLASRGAEHVAAFTEHDGVIFVAGPVAATTGSVVDLALAPGGTVRIAFRRPSGLAPEWPVTVERADGVPLLVADPPGRISGGVFRQFRLDESQGPIGPLACGDVDLVFRVAGREFGRRRVTVRANESVDVAAPELIPPERR